MIPSRGVFLVRQEQYQDLLREAEQERLVQVAGLRPSRKWGLPRQTANWLGAYIVKLGLQLQANRLTGPTCCDDYCLVELKANTPT
jgi:hypothetical protein